VVILADTDRLSFITGIRDDEVIASVGQPEMKAAVFLGKGSYSGILTKYRSAT